MQNNEIRPCAACGKGIANNGQGTSGPLVGARVIVQRLMIDPRNLNAHRGLEMHFAQAGPAGARAMADIMGPGSVIDEPAELRSELLLCEECLTWKAPTLPLLALLEQAAEAAEELEEAPADA